MAGQALRRLMAEYKRKFCHTKHDLIDLLIFGDFSFFLKNFY